MNLHSIVSGAISAINPSVIGFVQSSTGSTIGADFKPVPTYKTYPGVTMQVQPISTGDLKKLDALNIQGVERAVYLNGNYHGVERAFGRGGDLLTFNGATWLVKAVLEAWDQDGWTKLGVVQQNGS